MAGRPTPEKRRRGRPRLDEHLEPLQVRVGHDQRDRWRAAVAACGAAGWEDLRDESKWLRAGLDAWAEICEVAIHAGLPPAELVARLLQQHERSAALVAELEAARGKRALTVDEDRIFRTLAPVAWEAASFAGALTLAPSKRTAK